MKKLIICVAVFLSIRSYALQGMGSTVVETPVVTYVPEEGRKDQIEDLCDRLERLPALKNYFQTQFENYKKWAEGKNINPFEFASEKIVSLFFKCMSILGYCHRDFGDSLLFKTFLKEMLTAIVSDENIKILYDKLSGSIPKRAYDLQNDFYIRMHFEVAVSDLRSKIEQYK